MTGWRDGALCAQVDMALFFPGKGESCAAAKSICRRCEVQFECLEESVAQAIPHGIWGGRAAVERRRLIAARHRMQQSFNNEQEVA
jgi:WhiB family redox-sensing transcriptional regulator